MKLPVSSCQAKPICDAGQDGSVRRSRLTAILAAGLMAVGFGTASSLAFAQTGSSPSPTRPTAHAYVDAASTCPAAAIPGTNLSRGDHYVAAPSSTASDTLTGRKPVLVVFLGGSYTKPEDYVDISEYVASIGYGVINLSYPNDFTVGAACNNEAGCYGSLRGEVAFGRNIDYTVPSSNPGYGYNSGKVAGNISRVDSVVNRLVCLIDYLGNNGAQSDDIPGDDYWQQFLKVDSNSPYITPNAGRVYPDWSKIVVAGHSQGGGEAAFLGMRLPLLEPVRRVVMLSSPEDSTGSQGQPAPWMTYAANTPMNRFWGLWAGSQEGVYGEHVGGNWSGFGGPFISGVGGDKTGGVGRVTSVPVVEIPLSRNGTINLNSNRFQLQENLGFSALRYHRSTSGNCAALDNDCSQIREFLKPVWNYMFSGGYTD